MAGNVKNTKLRSTIANYLDANFRPYFDNDLFLAPRVRNPVIDYVRLILIASRAVYLPKSPGLFKAIKKAGRVAFVTSANQRRAIKNTFPQALQINIFSLIDRDASLFKFEFNILLVLLIMAGPFFALAGSLFFVFRHSKIYAVSCVFLATLISVSFARKMNLLSKKTVIFANDHAYYLRGLLLGLKNFHPVVYVQHGLIGKNFPNPDIFDQVYLDNIFSRDRYAEELEQSKVTLVSTRRFGVSVKPLIIPANKNPRELNIGLGFSDMDFAHQYVKYNHLNFEKYKSVALRLHPSLSISGSLNQEVIKLGILCDSNISLDSFFLGIDFLISDASSLLVDSLVFGVPSVQLNSGSAGDYYGLSASHIVPGIVGNNIVEAVKAGEKFDYSNGIKRLGF